jgi:hypothetical protein
MKFSPPILSCSTENFCFHVGDYSFGFNGQEKEKQITGENTHTSAEFWMYDARLGRRWQLDPKPDPSLSFYSVLRNSPLLFNDPLGDTVGLVAASMAAKPGAGAQGHMAIIVGNDELGYWIFSIENPKNMSGDRYVKQDEVIFKTTVQKIEALVSKTHEALLYAHCEDSFSDLECYMSENAPGVYNSDEHKGYGYDRIAVYNNSTPEMECELIDYLSSMTSSDFTYEVISNNCASFSMDAINEVFGQVICDETWADRPNKEFSRISNDSDWTIIKDEKVSHDSEREKLNLKEDCQE